MAVKVPLVRDSTTNLAIELSASDTIAISSISNIASGTYTPTLFNTTNVSASIPRLCQWLRVGSTVTVSGRFDITPTATATTTTVLGISIPVASNFSNNANLGGAGSVAEAPFAPCLFVGDTTNFRASMQYYATQSGSKGAWFTFTYQII